MRKKNLIEKDSKGYSSRTKPAKLYKLEAPANEKINVNNKRRKKVKKSKIIRSSKDYIEKKKNSELISGIIRFRQSGLAIFIPEKTVENSNQDSILIRSENTGVALHGDRVLVRLLKRHSISGSNDNLKKRAGQVIQVLERGCKSITGTLRRGRSNFHVIPDDPKFSRDIYVSNPSKSKLSPKPRINDKVVVKLNEWKSRYHKPEGQITKVLGVTHTPNAEYLGILNQYNLDPEFPHSVIREVKTLPDKVRKSDLVGRLDLRNVRTFTIDPDDAKDFDDAISVEQLNNGGYRVGVHIADVATYVKPKTLLDNEAQKRGNSTYLVGSVIPMLPFDLSNGICSLVEKQDRLTKTVFLYFSKSGEIQKNDFRNTVINSNKRLTYKQALLLLKEKGIEKIKQLPAPPNYQTGFSGCLLNTLSNEDLKSLQNDIRIFWKLAKQLRDNRMKSGSLDFDMTEIKILVDSNGYADKIIKIENDESHQMIEEFMLAANEAVAKKLMDKNIPLMHRVHDKPDEEKLIEYREYLLSLGIQVGDLTLKNEVKKLMQILKTHSQNYIIKIQFLRSMKQACYRAQAHGHYGLNKNYYTHFTSPIRRYSDLIIHRLFDQHIINRSNELTEKKPLINYNQNRLNSLAEHLSLTERNSTDAERESIKIKLLEYFEREVSKIKKTRFKAIITDIKQNGMFIELVDSMAFGLIPISSLTDDTYNFSSDGTTIKGRKNKIIYQVGQKIHVSIVKVNRFKRLMDFKIAN